jgi:D-alanyl-D-alanine carboxypeptidase
VTGAVGTAAAVPSGRDHRASTATTLDAKTKARLTQALDRAFLASGSPGLVVGVEIGTQRWTARRGVVDTTTKQPVSPLEHTRIGSLTKTITGTVVLQLVDAGKLRLDDTIERWFPDLPDARSITIRMLGDMSSGIASYTKDDATVQRYYSDPAHVWTPAELVAIGTGLPRLFPPGQGFQYSNTNFVMLGLIVEQVTGKAFTEVLRTKIFRPLGMRGSSYPLGTELPRPHWQGYTSQGAGTGPVDATGWSPTFASSAGEAVSTLNDMLTWAKALGTGSLLEAKTQRARLVGNPASKAGNREYAFAVGKDNGWLTHDGDIPGFNTSLAYFPKGKISIIVLTNSDDEANGSLPAPAIFNALAEAVAPNNVP